jgi:required for meiotic nuclear division protein 1
MKVSAVHIGDAIALKPILKKERSVLTWEGKSVVVFPFGVVVFWDLPLPDQARFFESFRDSISNFHESPLREAQEVHVGSEYAFADELITVPEISLKSIVVISIVLARSIALEEHEIGINALMEQFQPLRLHKHQNGRVHMSNRRLLRISSEAMDTHQAMSISMAMLDTPDIVWDDNELRSFYKVLREEYEIEFRYKQLTYKLKLLIQHSEFILHLMENRRSFLLEMTVIALIGLEVLLFGYDLWWK